MSEFFSDTGGIFPFELFGVLHIMMIVVMVGIIIGIYKYKERIRKWKYHDTFMRYLIACIMFLNMAIYYGNKIVTGAWDYRVHLPLHFCFISGYLFMYALVTNNSKMFKYIYFFSFAGPLPAILLPDLTCGMNRFLFWQYTISHHFFIIASMYCLYVLDWKIEWKDAITALKNANIIFLLVFCFNMIFHTNYIMTSNLPEHVLCLMPFLKQIDSPILLLELTGIGAWLVAYIPVYYLNVQNKYKIEMTLNHS